MAYRLGQTGVHGFYSNQELPYGAGSSPRVSARDSGLTPEEIAKLKASKKSWITTFSYKRKSIGDKDLESNSFRKVTRTLPFSIG